MGGVFKQKSDVTSSTQLSFPGVVESGNSVLVFISSWNPLVTNKVIRSVTDSKGNTYVNVGRMGNPLTNGYVEAFLGFSVAGGSGFTVTLSPELASGSTLKSCAFEIEGVTSPVLAASTEGYSGNNSNLLRMEFDGVPASNVAVFSLIGFLWEGPTKDTKTFPAYTILEDRSNTVGEDVGFHATFSNHRLTPSDPITWTYATQPQGSQGLFFALPVTLVTYTLEFDVDPQFVGQSAVKYEVHTAPDNVQGPERIFGDYLFHGLINQTGNTLEDNGKVKVVLSVSATVSVKPGDKCVVALQTSTGGVKMTNHATAAVVTSQDNSGVTVTEAQLEAPALTGTNIVGRPHSYQPGRYVDPITAAYYQIDGVRVQVATTDFPLRPTYYVHTHAQHRIEEVVAGVSYFSLAAQVLPTPSTITQFDERVGQTSSMATTDALGLVPNFAGDASIKGGDLGRRAGGSLYPTVTAPYGNGFLFLSVGADNQNHEVTFHDVAGGVQLELQMHVSAGNSSLYDGGQASGFGVRLHRGTAADSWSMSLLKYAGVGANATTLTTSSRVLPPTTESITIVYTDSSTPNLGATITATGAAPETLTVVDGDFRQATDVCVKVLVVGGPAVQPSFECALGKDTDASAFVLPAGDKFVLAYSDDFSDRNRARINADATVPSGSVHAYSHQKRWGPDVIINKEKQRFTFPGDLGYENIGAGSTGNDSPLTFDPFAFGDDHLTIGYRRASNDEKTLIRNTSGGTLEVDQPEFLSGMISTQNHYSFLYGYVEFDLSGVHNTKEWLSGWLLSIYLQEPPELDIAELDGGRVKSLHNAAHANPDLTENTYSKEGGYGSGWVSLPDPNSSITERHRWGMLWLPDRCIWYCDGVKTFEYPVEIFEPMYMLVTASIAPLISGFISPSNTTVLPTSGSFKCHGIRVWQQPSLNNWGPGVSTLPVITGTQSASGEVVLSSPASFSGAVSTENYWMQGSKRVSNDPTASYTKTSADIGKGIYYATEATNGSGQKRRVLSNFVYVAS